MKLRQVGKLLKYTIAVGAVGTTGILLQRNDWQVGSIGAVRFGRAAVTVSTPYMKNFFLPTGLPLQVSHVPAVMYVWNMVVTVNSRKSRTLFINYDLRWLMVAGIF